MSTDLTRNLLDQLLSMDALDAPRVTVTQLVEMARDARAELRLHDQRAKAEPYTATQQEAWLDGWSAARIYYGTCDTDDRDGGDEDGNHGAECQRVQGPYICTCDEAGQLIAARDFMPAALRP